VALLSTFQPLLPKFEMSLAPVPDGESRLMPAVAEGAALPAGDVAARGMACALDPSQSIVAVATAAAAQRAEWRRMVRLIAGNSCPAAVNRERRAPPLNNS